MRGLPRKLVIWLYVSQHDPTSSRFLYVGYKTPEISNVRREQVAGNSEGCGWCSACIPLRTGVSTSCATQSFWGESHLKMNSPCPVRGPSIDRERLSPGG